MQTIEVQQAPTKTDIVTAVVYDAFGRIAKEYLPYMVQQNNGRYRSSNWQTEQSNFYNDPANTIADDTRPFSEKIFDESPLNRPVEEYGHWVRGQVNRCPAITVVNGFQVGSENERIISWRLDVLGMPVRRSALEGFITSGGYYDSVTVTSYRY